VTRVAVVGPRTMDVVSLEDGGTVRRPGGSPFYAERALRAAGAEPVLLENRGVVQSRLEHGADGTRQQILATALPLTAADVSAALPRLAGCRWAHLGGQTAGDFPPEVIAALRDAGIDVLLDGQGLARGTRLGPVRLGPFDPRAVEGVTCLKLNAAEAQGSLGGDDSARVRRLGLPEVLITHSQAGLVVVTQDTVVEAAGNGQPFADPTGAGDTVAALYCLARSEGADPPAAARAAVQGVERLYGTS
jgi:sugar/nucleoside kinase (ribokinase family)